MSVLWLFASGTHSNPTKQSRIGQYHWEPTQFKAPGKTHLILSSRGREGEKNECLPMLSFCDKARAAEKMEVLPENIRLLSLGVVKILNRWKKNEKKKNRCGMSNCVLKVRFAMLLVSYLSAPGTPQRIRSRFLSVAAAPLVPGPAGPDLGSAGQSQNTSSQNLGSKFSKITTFGFFGFGNPIKSPHRKSGWCVLPMGSQTTDSPCAVFCHELFSFCFIWWFPVLFWHISWLVVVHVFYVSLFARGVRRVPSQAPRGTSGWWSGNRTPRPSSC